MQKNIMSSNIGVECNVIMRVRHKIFNALSRSISCNVTGVFVRYVSPQAWQLSHELESIMTSNAFGVIPLLYLWHCHLHGEMV